jgi:hypothetical protein
LSPIVDLRILILPLYSHHYVKVRFLVIYMAKIGPYSTVDGKVIWAFASVKQAAAVMRRKANMMNVEAAVSYPSRDNLQPKTRDCGLGADA